MDCNRTVNYYALIVSVRFVGVSRGTTVGYVGLSKNHYHLVYVALPQIIRSIVQMFALFKLLASVMCSEHTHYLKVGATFWLLY